MTRYLGLLAAAMLVACGGGDTDPNDTDTDDDPDACANEIDGLFPADGANDVYYRTHVEFALLEAKGDETITVSAGGDAVSGTTTIDGYRVVWTPSAPLAPSTTYDVTLDWECGSTSVQWTTSDVGSPVDETSLVGNTYTLDIASGLFLEPAGIGDLIGSFLDQEILIGVSYASATEVEMTGALGLGNGQQDVCVPTIDFPVAADFSENPYFSVVTNVLELEVSGFEVRIDDLEISGAFAPDGSSIEGAVLKGVLDARMDALGELGDPDEICALVGGFGIQCQPCPADGADYCLAIHVADMTAPQVAGSLEPRTAEDIAGDASCN